MNHHHANVGDVVKHLALGELLALTTPAVYAESHAGAASYPLATLRDRTHDVRHFLEGAAADPRLASTVYVAALREAAHRGVYPGSAEVALAARPPGTEFHFHDLNKDSLASVTAAGEARGARVHCHHHDGLAGVLAYAQPRAFIFLDPFRLDARHNDGPDTPETFTALAATEAVTLMWYPLLTRDDSAAVAAQLPAGTRRFDFWLDAPGAGLPGCGLAAANMPTRAWRTAIELLRTLADHWDAELSEANTSSVEVLRILAEHWDPEPTEADTPNGQVR